MKDEVWFSRVRDEIFFSPLAAATLDAIVPLECIGLDELSFGYRLRLVTPSSAVEIQLMRRMRGVTLTSAEEKIALGLHEQNREIEAILAEHSLETPPKDSIERLWLFILLMLFSRSWRQLEFPESDLASLLTTWGDQSLIDLTRLRSRGLDSIFFGAKARARYFLEIERILDGERASMSYRKCFEEKQTS